MKPEERRARVLVLASGNGGNFEALARAAKSGEAPIDMVGLVGDRPAAPCFERARRLGIETLALPVEGRTRQEYDARLAEAAEGFSPDWILLLGWMRILSKAFLGRFPGRVINLHPALPGRFPGTEAIRRAWDAARAGQGDRTGVMLHHVPDEGVDTGPPILVREVEIGSEESLDSLESRMHLAEHELVIELAKRLRRDRIYDQAATTRPGESQGGTT